jgi:hypothetical protein
VSTDTITFDNTVPSTGAGNFSKCDGAGANDGTLYTAGNDGDFGTGGEDFEDGLVEFNRAVADFKIGDAVGAQLGKLSVLSGGTEQIVGFVIGIDVLHRELMISPFPASKYRGV